MILVVTNRDDSHADAAIRVFNARGVRVFRLNTEDLLTRYQCEFRLGRQLEYPRLLLHDSQGRTLDLAELKVAWFRKPDYEFNLRTELDQDRTALAWSEAKAIVETIYAAPGVTWVNDPFCASRSKTKLQQLLLAKQMGMNIPETIITNSVHAALTFHGECGDVDMLTKAVYSANIQTNGIPIAIPSTRIGAREFRESSPSIELLPTNLQEYVEKKFELRVTVIGQKAFGVKIDSQLHEETKVDWRMGTDLNPHAPFDLPAKIERFCVEFVEKQGLLYGAIDLIVRPDGQYVFLENNPFGQYLWLELLAGVPLTIEMCDFLISLSQRD
jgi:glutathione synthase/RimK-type ligase-like ATP-grasp enzyme